MQCGDGIYYIVVFPEARRAMGIERVSKYNMKKDGASIRQAELMLNF